MSPPIFKYIYISIDDYRFFFLNFYFKHRYIICSHAFYGRWSIETGHVASDHRRESNPGHYEVYRPGWYQPGYY